jgi:hypothetical protein
VASYCGDCRVSLGRLEGRGHEGEDGLVTPEALIEKWRETWQRLWDRKARLGTDFPELAQIQLRLAGEVIRDLEAVYGPLAPRNPRPSPQNRKAS